MNKKIWSAPIALIVVLVTALVFGGITVSADTVAEGECGTGVIFGNYFYVFNFYNRPFGKIGHGLLGQIA